jgi:hypothetical protein
VPVDAVGAAVVGSADVGGAIGAGGAGVRAAEAAGATGGAVAVDGADGVVTGVALPGEFCAGCDGGVLLSVGDDAVRP